MVRSPVSTILTATCWNYGNPRREPLWFLRLTHLLQADLVTRDVEMIHQLRIYEIFEHNKAAFHDRFRDHAARIMKSYGFDLIAMWESKTNDRTEFAYLLAWPDEQTMLQAWGQFRADEEWKKIKKLTNTQYGDLVGVIEERTLVPTNYSPSIRRTKLDNK